MPNTENSGGGHKGISHPFGAKHDSVQRADLPLEDRLWPNFVNDLAVKYPEVAKDVWQKRNAEAVDFDILGTFAEQREKYDSKARPDWKPYAPEHNAPVPYCSLGVRPLDDKILSGIYGASFGNIDMEHQQMIFNDGAILA